MRPRAPEKRLYAINGINYPRAPAATEATHAAMRPGALREFAAASGDCAWDGHVGVQG